MIPQIGIFSTYMNHKDIRIFDHFKMFPVRHYCTYDIFKFRYHHSFVEKYVIKFCKLNEFGEEKRRENYHYNFNDVKILQSWRGKRDDKDYSEIEEYENEMI